MRKTLILLVTFVSFGLATVDFSARRLDDRTAVHTNTSAVPIIQIETAPKLAQSQPLAFNCRISNSGSEPLFIYSSLLQNPRFTEILIDRKQKLIELKFTQLEASPLVPYYFPAAAFREMPANKPENFSVASTSAIKDLRGYELINGTSREARITAGRWQLKIMIGYGNDVSAVKIALASDTEGKEHPINEIVKWQKVAFSNSITINVTK